MIEARWIPNKYNLTIQTTGGIILDQYDVNYNDAIDLPYVYEVDNYTYYISSFIFNGDEYSHSDLLIYDVLDDAIITVNTLDILLNNSFTFEFTDSNDSLVITGYSGEFTELIIPEYGYFEECIYPITEIEGKIGNEFIAKLEIPETITKYNEYDIFENCTALEELTISYLNVKFQ